jgi:uncharacterized protein (TIGR02271 family)
MTNETIVAIYDSSEQAALAVRDLEAAGVSSSAISKHADGGLTAGSTTTTSHREQGFWASLFGGEPEHDTAVYNRSLESGSTVVTVKVPEHHLTRVMDILERHDPIDIDERAMGYGGENAVTGPNNASHVNASPVIGAGGRVGESEAIPLTEERLSVGKRAVNRGTTRVRRYVVETPVEENISLRDETVSVERRPVADARPVTNADFTDKVVEVTETAEEAVVSKTARVKEEVVIHKEAAERTETVRDTVRREDVEITKEPGTERATGATSAVPAGAPPRI